MLVLAINPKAYENLDYAVRLGYNPSRALAVRNTCTGIAHCLVDRDWRVIGRNLPIRHGPLLEQFARDGRPPVRAAGRRVCRTIAPACCVNHAPDRTIPHA